MPTYEYRCKECGDEFDVVQSFTDDALTTCEACGGPLRKVFGNVGIAFKGTGFYKNDSRGKSSAGANGSSSESPASTTDAPTTSSDAATTSTAKPSEKSEKKSEPTRDAPPAKKVDTASKG